MTGDYTTILDLGEQAVPLLPLALVAVLALLVAGLLFAAKRLTGRLPPSVALTLWGAFLFHAGVVGFGYWSLWRQQAAARDPAAVVVEIGRIAAPQIRGESGGVYLDLRQRFTVNGETFDYAHRRIRGVGFLFPNVETIPLPLIQQAHVRVTYRGKGEDRQVLKFEIATADLADAQAQ